MAEYGYEYRIFSTYSTGTVRNETREPVIKRPFVPSLPKSNGNKEGHATRKTIVPITSSRPYDGTNEYGGYSDDDDHYYYNNNNNNKKEEGYKPTSLPIRKNDGYNNNNNNGYGIGNGNNKEQRRPFGNATRNNNNNNRGGHKHYPNGPKISSDWTKAPRKGTQLSEPTHDIEKALELLKMEAAKREQSNANNKDDYEYEYDRPPSSTPLANWAAPAPGNGNGSRFADLITSKFDKGTGSPHSRSSMPMEPASPNKGGNYRSEIDDHDRKGPMRTIANFNHPSRPRMPTIDSTNAVKMYNGTRV